MRSPLGSASGLLCATVVLVVVAGCAATDERSTAAPPSSTADRCAQPAVTSGRVTVGTPPPRRGLVVVDPASPPPRPDALPTVAAVTLTPTASDVDDVRYDFVGDGVVAWSARFVEAPTAHGTDAAVPIAGTCVLQVDLSGVADDQSASTTAQPARVTSPRATQVVEVLRYGSDRQIAQSFLGLRSPTARVSPDDAGARLIIRVAG